MQQRDLLRFEDMEERIVAFVDILGFNSLVKNIKDDSSFIRCASTLDDIMVYADTVDKDQSFFSRFNFTAVSDSMIISVPNDSFEGLIKTLILLHHIQYDFLSSAVNPILFRGFITKGPVYHKSGFVFGAGYSAAYEGERLIGSAPRIVVAPDLVVELPGSELGKEAFRYLKEDRSDGFFFIDYFNGLLRPTHTLEKKQHILELIEANMQQYKYDLRIFPKYKWLSNYLAESSAHFS